MKKAAKIEKYAPLFAISMILLLVGTCSYQIYSWQPDKIIHKEYLGTVEDIKSSPLVSKSGSKDSYQTTLTINQQDYTLSARQPQPTYLIKRKARVWLADAVLNGGKSRLHRTWVVVLAVGSREETYYSLAGESEN